MAERLLTILLLAVLFFQRCSAESLSEDGVFNDVAREWSSYEHAALCGGVLVDSNEHLSFVDKFSSGPAIAAVGSYVDGAVTASNFGHLHITTFSSFKDEVQMRAAGFLEGWLSAERIYDHHMNMKAFYNLSSSAVPNWLVAQDKWAQREAKKRGGHEPVWSVTHLLLKQLQGLVEGYNMRVAAHQGLRLPRLTRTDFLLLSAVGDVGDLQPALEVDKQPEWQSMEAHVLEASLYTTSKCSALVKLTADFSNLLLSHSSWFTYSGMVRIFKHYSFSLSNRHHKLRRASFSSYPGELSSDDDFYMLDTGLVVLQTTNNIYNTSLYSLLTPNTLLNWQRVRLASAMATTGAEWAKVVGMYNSGTYNNQYMVVDLKRFQPRQALQEGLLWVVEQIPGLAVSADKTEMLEWGYWPSYNVPYFREIYQRAGYPEFVAMQASRGPAYAEAVAGLNHELAPRAKIFRRDVGTVTDIESLKRLMRSNKWPHDPLSGGSSFGAICGRGDVDKRRPLAYGCYDTKVTDYKMAKQLLAEAVNGPTREGHPPFVWSASELSATSHIGEVDEFDFNFELMHPFSSASDV